MTFFVICVSFIVDDNYLTGLLAQFSDAPATQKYTDLWRTIIR